jgi:hypothetical protein
LVGSIFWIYWIFFRENDFEWPDWDFDWGD